MRVSRFRGKPHRGEVSGAKAMLHELVARIDASSGLIMTVGWRVVDSGLDVEPCVHGGQRRFLPAVDKFLLVDQSLRAEGVFVYGWLYPPRGGSHFFLRPYRELCSRLLSTELARTVNHTHFQLLVTVVRARVITINGQQWRLQGGTGKAVTWGE